MRRSLVVVAFLAAIAGLWIWVEGHVADRAAEAIAARPDLSATEVRPLRDPLRFGLHVAGPELTLPDMTITLDGADVFLRPQSPLTLSLTPSRRGRLMLAGRSIALELNDASVSASIAPLRGPTLGAARLETGVVMRNDAPLLERALITANLAGLDQSMPTDTGAAYDLELQLDGLRMALPWLVSVAGQGQVWLDVPPVAGGPSPRLMGLRTQGLQLRLGDMTIRLIGRVQRGADGRTEGRLAVYTSDAEAFVTLATEAGLIPAQGQTLIRAMLGQMTLMPMPEPAQPDGLTFPGPVENELHIPLILRDGQVFMGEMPIAPAPFFPG